MDTRKMYLRPAVESEDVLEQTSLACNLIMTADATGFPSCGPTLDEACWVPLFKGGAWDATTEACTSVPLAGPACAVQFS